LLPTFFQHEERIDYKSFFPWKFGAISQSYNGVAFGVMEQIYIYIYIYRMGGKEGGGRGKKEGKYIGG
jgi:hypothetical protein